MDIRNSIMDIHNCIIGKPPCRPSQVTSRVVLRENVRRGNLHLVQEIWLKFQYAIIATHNAIKDN